MSSACAVTKVMGETWSSTGDRLGGGVGVPVVVGHCQRDLIAAPDRVCSTVAAVLVSPSPKSQA